ncbi:hypothetical protein LCGC14_1126260 [marine sediment metagenome]|uniref:Uncharacterized protein n=1 Tax=marine sediment metagenome TaxID=412755 RepID=A0A0F9PKJ7_9ZZZZ
MSKAVICPVCDGTGRVSLPFDGSGTCPADGGVCHGCGGQGWVTVGETTAEVSCNSPLPWWTYPQWCQPNGTDYRYSFTQYY